MDKVLKTLTQEQKQISTSNFNFNLNFINNSKKFIILPGFLRIYFLAVKISLSNFFTFFQHNLSNNNQNKLSVLKTTINHNNNNNNNDLSKTKNNNIGFLQSITTATRIILCLTSSGCLINKKKIEQYFEKNEENPKNLTNIQNNNTFYVYENFLKDLFFISNKSTSKNNQYKKINCNIIQKNEICENNLMHDFPTENIFEAIDIIDSKITVLILLFYY
jgi:hypothetical protein